MHQPPHFEFLNNHRMYPLRFLRRFMFTLGALAGCCVSTAVWAQDTRSAIYSCVDSKGRKITADRPIPECVDREQKLLNPSGTVKGRVGPSLTAQERADLEAQEKRDFEERNRRNDERRRDRALLTRYPNQSVHDKERVEALAQVDLARAAAAKNVADLQKQRVRIDAEMEFYAKDQSKAPPTLRRQSEEFDQTLAVQARFIAEQDNETARVNARFDEERVRLRQLWRSGSTSAAPAGASSKPR